MSDTPDVPGEEILQRSDQHLAGCADELIDFATAAREYIHEGRYQEGYEQLNLLLAAATFVMQILPQVGTLDLRGRPSMSSNPGPPSVYALMDDVKEGRLNEAYAEYLSLLWFVMEVGGAFRFGEPTMHYGFSGEGSDEQHNGE